MRRVLRFWAIWPSGGLLETRSDVRHGLRPSGTGEAGRAPAAANSSRECVRIREVVQQAVRKGAGGIVPPRAIIGGLPALGCPHSFTRKESGGIPGPVPGRGLNMPSPPFILGEHPFARTPQGKLKCRIGTIFPHEGVLVMLPGIHAMQRQSYLDWVNAHRRAAGRPALTPEERTAIWNGAVDLVVEDDHIFIRPDPANMPLAFEADNLLQEMLPKHRIRFLHVLNLAVRQAIKERGELWRIAALPHTIDEMKAMIAASRIGIGGREIYYYNKTTGTRYLTYQELVGLGTLGEEELRQHLLEIATYSRRQNAQRNLEIRFFGAEESQEMMALWDADFASVPSAALWERYHRLKEAFRQTLPPVLLHDDPSAAEWRNRMVSALVASGTGRDDQVTEEVLLGLSPEFYMGIRWLPGGRIVHGELFCDSVFEQAEATQNPELLSLCDNNVRQFILNYMREFGDLEYVNIGRVIGSLSQRRVGEGRRDVYLTVLKTASCPREVVRVIRMMKWGVREHLDRGRPLDEAMIRSEEYREYVLDRRVACRHLGMNLPPRVTANRISEAYSRGGCTFRIWSVYFEREYVPGIATDKLPQDRFHNPEYALRFAELMGRAAASNIIVGRCDVNREVLFDDGDEMIIEDPQGLPVDLVVADPTGTFNDFTSAELCCFAEAYARPIRKRLHLVADAPAFAQAYLQSFVERFREIQEEYRRHRSKFDMLFRYVPPDAAGNFPFRWQCVLARLDQADPEEIARHIHRHIFQKDSGARSPGRALASSPV